MVWKHSFRNVNIDLKRSIKERVCVSDSATNKLYIFLHVQMSIFFMWDAEYNHVSPREWTSVCVKNIASRSG